MTSSAGRCRILHLEDSASDAELVAERLRLDGFAPEVERVETRRAFTDTLTRGGAAFDLILADLALPDFDGMAALVIARKLSPDIPFIFVSGTLGEDEAIEAVKAGATDYVVKQRLKRLPVTVRRALAEAQERAERRAAKAELGRSEARMARLLATTPAGVIELNAEGRFAYANVAAERILGVEPGGLAGRLYADPAWQVTAANGDPVPLERLPGARALSGEQVVDYEHVVTALDGRRVTLLVDIVPVRSNPDSEHPDGRVTSALAAFQDVTARHEAARALHDSEERLRALVTASSEVLYRMSSNWAEMRQLTGNGFLAETNSRNQAWLEEYVHSDDQPRVVEAIKEAVRTKGIFELEHRVRLADGSLGWTHSRAVPILNSSGEIKEWFGAASNVTARKEAEEALRESEALFRLMADAVPQIVWITDRYGRMEFRNRQFVDYTGVVSGAPEPAEMATFIHPDDGPASEIAFNVTLETGEAFEIEHRIRSAAGNYRWFLARAEPYRNPQTGEVVRWFGASVDIHDRKLAEQRLHALNETLETQVAARTAERDSMWDMSPDLMLVIDSAGVLRRVNPAWTTALGYVPDELVGFHVDEFVLADHHSEAVDAYKPAAKGGRPRIENRCRHKDGSIRWISWVAATAGDVTYAIGRDITAAKDRQAELEQVQEQLRQSQKMEAVGQLTGGIAHDFNNMLQAIGGNLELLGHRLAQGRTAEAARFAKSARETVARGAALTHRLLAFARRQTLQPKTVETDTLIAGMAELIRRTVGPGVAVELRLDDGVWTVLCDPSQLENALLNLAINARDAMVDGGTLTIGTEDVRLSKADVAEQEIEPGDYVEVTVADTGSGMDQATRARAFEPFFTTKPLGQGTGLGLSQVYGFVRQSGGITRLDSAPGAGTTVRLYLPRHEQVRERPAHSLAPGKPDLQGAGGTVLLVEDDIVVREVTAEHLRELGFGVLEAEDGPVALRLLRAATHLDLLVTDVGLPGGLNGRQVADIAREHRPDLPVLFITGYAGGAVEGALPPGMALIVKPFSLAALAAEIRATLEMASA